MKINPPDQNTISDEILNQRAALYAQVESKIEIKGVIKEYLAFRLGPQWYMVDTHELSEILPPQRISFLPRNKKFLSGVMNVRGNIVLIVDIKTLLDIPAGQNHLHAKIVLTRINGDLTGFMADEILGVQRIDTYDIKPGVSGIQGLKLEFIHGLYQNNNKHFVLLNLEQLWLQMVNKLGKGEKNVR